MTRCGLAAGAVFALAAVAALPACDSGSVQSPASAAPLVPSGHAQSRARHDSLRYRYMTDTSDSALTKSLGFNLVDVEPDRGLIDALPAGQRALVWIGNYSLQTCTFDRSAADIRRVLAALAGDRKVAGYYIADEADDALPSFGGHCPQVIDQMRARDALVHSLAPGAFTYEIVTEPQNFALFANVTDVLGADPYPCLHHHACDWSMIPRYIADLSAAHVRRYWGVLQAFSSTRWRYPTPAELLRMIRQWELSDWQGEQAFAWTFMGNSLARQPGLLAVLRAFNEGRVTANAVLRSTGKRR